MQYIKLPHSELEISRIGFGAWPIAGGFNWGPQDEKDSRAALRASYDAGINFFDTAKGYGSGKSEELIATELSDVRKKIIIATKISPNELKYNNIMSACENRLKALKTDYIDLLQIHWPNWDIPIEESLQGMEDLKREGKIRAYGLSNFGKIDMSDAIAKGGELSSNQLPYNLLWRAIEYEILPLCIKEKVPVIAYMPLMQGLLSGKFHTADQVPSDRARTRHFSEERSQTRHFEEGAEMLTFDTIRRIRECAADEKLTMVELSISWLLGQVGVGSVLVGARNVEQVEENTRAAVVHLSEEVLQHLNKLTDPLKEQLGRNPDMWQDADESRYR